jgi:hypothetical protein
MGAILPSVSWQRMSDAIEKVRRRLLRAAGALEGAGVPYAVVGGNAIAAWVSRADESAVRNTRDVDILIRRADLSAAMAALAAAGFVHRRVASLGRAGRMAVFLDGPEARVRDSVHIIFAEEKTADDSPTENPDVGQSEDAGDFRLINLDALVEMKLAAWRDKDRVHLRDLVEVGLVDAFWLDRYSGELRRRLQHILDTPEE